MPGNIPKWDPNVGLHDSSRRRNNFNYRFRGRYQMDDSDIRTGYANGQYFPKGDSAGEQSYPQRRAESVRPRRVNRVGMFANAKTSAIILNDLTPAAQQNVQRTIQELVAPDEDDLSLRQKSSNMRRHSSDGHGQKEIESNPVLRRSTRLGEKRALEGHPGEGQQRRRKYSGFGSDDDLDDQPPLRRNSTEIRNSSSDRNNNVIAIYDGYNPYESGYRPILPDRVRTEPDLASVISNGSNPFAPAVCRYSNSLGSSIMPTHGNKPFVPPVNRHHSSHRSSVNPHHQNDPVAPPLRRHATSRGHSGRKYDVPTDGYDGYDVEPEVVRQASSTCRSSVEKREKARSPMAQEHELREIPPRNSINGRQINSRLISKNSGNTKPSSSSSRRIIPRILARHSVPSVSLFRNGSGRYGQSLVSALCNSVKALEGSGEAVHHFYNHTGLLQYRSVVEADVHDKQHEEIFEVDVPYIEDIATSPPPTPKRQKQFLKAIAKPFPIKDGGVKMGVDHTRYRPNFHEMADHDDYASLKMKKKPQKTKAVGSPYFFSRCLPNPPNYCFHELEEQFSIDKVLNRTEEPSFIQKLLEQDDGNVDRSNQKAGSSKTVTSVSSTDNLLQEIQHQLDAEQDPAFLNIREIVEANVSKPKEKPGSSKSHTAHSDFLQAFQLPKRETKRLHGSRDRGHSSVSKSMKNKPEKEKAGSSKTVALVTAKEKSSPPDDFLMRIEAQNNRPPPVFDFDFPSQPF